MPALESDGYIFTPRARLEMSRRGLAETVVLDVLRAPGQRVEIRRVSIYSGGTGRRPSLARARLRRRRSATGGSRHRLSDEPDRQVLEGERHMKVAYDPRTDTLSVILRDDAHVATSDEDKPGVILDYDTEGNLISLEILDASRRVTDARRVEFQLTE